MPSVRPLLLLPLVLVPVGCKERPEVVDGKWAAIEARVAMLEARIATLEDAGRRTDGTDPDPTAKGDRCSPDAVQTAAKEGRSADVKRCVLPHLRPATSDELRPLKAACTIPPDQACLDEIRRAEASRPSDPLEPKF